MDVIKHEIEHEAELTRAHWALLLESDPWLEAVLAYLPPRQPEAEIFRIGNPQHPYALCVIVPIADGFEIKNIATRTIMRRQGMASALINHVVQLARQRGVQAVEIGTGETPGVMGNAQVRLYEKLGFVRDGVLKGFFSRYPIPIIENGHLLRDMVMLRQEL
jgi:GNAT superfamily N-acetyltransferase